MRVCVCVFVWCVSVCAALCREREKEIVLCAGEHGRDANEEEDTCAICDRVRGYTRI